MLLSSPTRMDDAVHAPYIHGAASSVNLALKVSLTVGTSIPVALPSILLAIPVYAVARSRRSP